MIKFYGQPKEGLSRIKDKCHLYPRYSLTKAFFQFTRKTILEERPWKQAIVFQESQVVRNLDQQQEDKVLKKKKNSESGKKMADKW